ncbi:MAG: hypothetical protein IK007_07625 [Lachnospiraceae bacterium]|nr:hypothetical protein [Lachnospiraceae bacterium]
MDENNKSKKMAYISLILLIVSIIITGVSVLFLGSENAVFIRRVATLMICPLYIAGFILSIVATKPGSSCKFAKTVFSVYLELTIIIIVGVTVFVIIGVSVGNSLGEKIGNVFSKGCIGCLDSCRDFPD